MNEQTTALRWTRPRDWLGLGAALVAVLVLVFLIAVAGRAGSGEPGGTGALGSAPPDASANPVTDSASAAVSTGDSAGGGDIRGEGGQGEVGQGDSGQTDGGQTDGGQTDGGQTDDGQPATPAPAGPEIEYFGVAQSPQCPGGTDNVPTEGQPVVLEWKVTGTDQVTLSIDGPGAYTTYPAEGSDTIAFPCAGEEGDIQQHTYLLTAQNPDGTSTGTLVVEATVHEQAQT
jgi:hypothetical protein